MIVVLYNAHKKQLGQETIFHTIKLNITDIQLDLLACHNESIDLILNWSFPADAGGKQQFCFAFGIEHRVKSLFAATINSE